MTNDFHVVLLVSFAHDCKLVLTHIHSYKQSNPVYMVAVRELQKFQKTRCTKIEMVYSQRSSVVTPAAICYLAKRGEKKKSSFDKIKSTRFTRAVKGQGVNRLFLCRLLPQEKSCPMSWLNAPTVNRHQEKRS